MVLWPQEFNLVMIMLFWLMSLTCSGPCPDDIMKEVMSCLYNLTRGGESVINGGDAKLMQENCEYGGFKDSIRCLRGVYASCTDPKKKEAFYKYASIDAWESGFERFCSNINLYMEKQECIVKQDREIDQCIKRNTERHVNKPDTVSQIDQYSNRKVTVLKTCRFFHWTQHCYEQPIGLQCGQVIRAILSDFAGGITPPICRDYQPPINASSKSCVSPTIVLFLCTILLTLIQR